MHGLGGGRLWVGLPFHPLERFRCLKGAGHPCPGVCAPGAHSALVRRFRRLPVSALVDASG